MNEQPALAIIGGSGLYAMKDLTVKASLEIDTPFGPPSAPILIGELSGKPIAFLARHGIGHTFNPTEVNYRANIYALKSIGIQQIVSISACGSLRDDFAPGHIVIPDQLFDFTSARENSFFTHGLVTHVGVGDPYCPHLSEQAYQACLQTGAAVHRGGTLITIEGPRFSTRAESNLFRAWGMSIIGMTACPEAFLAREAEMCYTTVAHVTDYDVWHVSEAPVSVEMVIRTLHKNTEIAQQSVANLARDLQPQGPRCECGSALANAVLTQRDHIPAATLNRLSLLVKKIIPSS